MRTDTLTKVADAIGTGTRSITDITRKTGLAYNTVKNALPHLNAVRVPDTSPALWELPGRDRSKVGRRKTGKPTVEIEVTEHDDWPTRWNNARREFAKQVAGIEIDPRASAKDLADQFMRAATSLASAGHAIAQHADKPDWYTLIGGVLESDEDTK